MKKKHSVVISILLVCTFLLCACNFSSSNTSSSHSDSDTIRFATGGTSGTDYTYGSALSQVFNEKLENVNLTVQSTGAGKANIFAIEDDKADLAIVGNDVLYYAYQGTDLFAADGAITGFSAVAALYPEVCQIIARKDLTAIEDLKGLRISVGNTNSSVESNAREILEAYGISFDDIIVQHLGLSDSVDALKSNKIDAFFCTTDLSDSPLSALDDANAVSILSIDDAHTKKLIDSYPFYSQYVIPADTYNGLKTPVSTVAIKKTLIASNELDEDVVKSIIDGLFTYQEDIAASHKKGKELDFSFATSSIGIPFHPGVTSYLQETGTLS